MKGSLSIRYRNRLPNDGVQRSPAGFTDADYDNAYTLIGFVTLLGGALLMGLIGYGAGCFLTWIWPS